MSGDQWFLDRVLKQLAEKNRERVEAGRLIHKIKVYRHMSWLHRCGKKDTRKVMRQLSVAFPGVVWSNRGLTIPASYLPPKKTAPQPARTDDRGGASDGVVG